MFRRLVLTLCVSVLFLGVGSAAFANPNPKDLQRENDELRRQVEALEAQLQTCQAATPVRAIPDASERADREAQANDLYLEARELLVAGEIAGARAKLQEVVDNFVDTRARSRAERALSEVNLIGSDAAPLIPEWWFQGSVDAHPELPTLVVFWEQWCPHCLREVPDLQSTYERYSGRLNVVGFTKMSRDVTESDVRGFLAENGITYPIGYENGDLTAAYVVVGIPAAAIVYNGQVVWRGHPGLISDDLLEQYLD